MKCPKCGGEMKKGFLSSSGFAPGPVVNKKIFWYSKKGILGAKDKLTLGNDLEAFMCGKCRTIVMNY